MCLDLRRGAGEGLTYGFQFRPKVARARIWTRCEHEFAILERREKQPGGPWSFHKVYFHATIPLKTNTCQRLLL